MSIDPDADDEDDSGDPDDDLSTTPTEWEYTCLHEMQSVVKACDGDLRSAEDVLVIRSEYEWLRETMETGYLQGDQSIVVTGQPGIGKTVFLLYLLLHRLEHKLPTAIHLLRSIVVFNQEGATMWDVSAKIIIPEDYWALEDSNDTVIKPCESFRLSAARLVVTSSPKPDRWHGWLTQANGSSVVSELPRPLEIMAILKEFQLLKLDTDEAMRATEEAYHLINKWGPCTRKIIAIMRKYPDNHSSKEDQFEGLAKDAAIAVCAHPSALRSHGTVVAPHSTGSSILFLSPYRPRDPVTRRVTSSSLSIPYIPTPFLTRIFNSERVQQTNDKALELFNSLSTHAFTRSSSAWHFERCMHAYLCGNSQPLSIFFAQHSSTMTPSQQLLVGTASALARCSMYPAFYWLPSASNFPGIDGVLADSANVYAVQATISDDHRSPADGLRKLWTKFDRKIRQARAWHVVFVAPSEDLARGLAARCTGEMGDLTLGRSKVPVKIWGCVLSQVVTGDIRA
ncbi:hypothetical protein L226DRAFT_490073 [Lentinus tigrinus ALCF2SS1-7]|nr:hypothetical protein L226DRAFT_490073 [Lentinus tigrinus ALCF2SS1-7]